MAEEKPLIGKSNGEFKEAPKWLGAVAAVVAVGIIGAAIIVPIATQSSKPSNSTDNTETTEQKHDSIPDDCITNADMKTSSYMKSTGGFMSYADASHTDMGDNEMLHRWKGEYKDGREGTYSCYTTIQDDGSEKIKELWLDMEQLL